MIFRSQHPPVSGENHNLDQILAILDGLPARVVVFDRDLRVTWANRSALGTLGRGIEEVVGVHCYKLWNDRDSICTTCHVKAVFDDGASKRRELTLEGGRVVGIDAFPLFDENGDLEKVVEISEDITHSKRTETALEESREQYKGLADATFEAVFVSDNGYCIDTNQTAVDMFGYSRSELIGIFGTDVIAPESKERVAENMLSGYEKSYEVVAQRKDGSRFLAEIRGKMMHYKGKNVRVTVVRDIDRRKRIEEALRTSEERYRVLFENANDAIFVAQDEVIKFPNPLTLQVTGYSREELEQIPFVQLIHPEDRDMVVERYRKRLAGKNPPATYAFRMVDKSGREVWVEINAVAFQWEGRPAILNFVRDITRQKMMENRLRHAQIMESIVTLTGGVAHDFNNILGIILGNAELAADDVPEWNPARRNLDEILSAGTRAKGVIDQLLSFSRKTDLRRSVVDMVSLVGKSINLLRSSVSSGIDIRTDLPGRAAAVLADPGQLHQVLFNLTTNAAQSIAGKGTVEIRLDRQDIPAADDNNPAEPENLQPGAYIRLQVSDSGPGMAADVQRRIFDPYFTTKNFGEGSGLGLAVVHGIVTEHGGGVSVSSLPGIGTTFSVYLPEAGSKS